MPRKRLDSSLHADDSQDGPPVQATQFLELATKLASAYLSNNQVPAAEIPTLISGIHASIAGLEGRGPTATLKSPAVPIKRSITEDFIVCLEDGKKLRTLKRYLRTQYQLTPEAYRAKWGLPHDYPMVAPTYAKLRSAFAKKIGLGRAPGSSKSNRRKLA